MTPIHQNQASQTEARRAGHWLVLDKLGAVGAFLAAAAAPCCFPLLAAVGAALGLGALQSLRGYVDYTIQAMVLVSLVGGVLAYRQHRQRAPLAAGIAAAGVIFIAYHGYYHVALVYFGLLGLTVAAVWSVIAKRRCAACCPNGTP